MKEKLKNLMSKKIFMLIGVLVVVAVAVVVATLSQDKGEKKGKTSNKKQMLENYANEGETEEETTISPNDYTVDTVFDVNTEEIECLIKATIDYAMVSDSPMMSEDSYSYWKGVQIGVSRMYDLECYKDKITLIDDGRNKWYQVDKVVVEEIGMAMSESAPEWVEGETGLEGFVEYDLTTKSYLFKKYKNIDYYIDYEYEVTEDNSMGTTGAIYVTTSLSAEYPSAYAVKNYKIDFNFPAYNAFGLYIMSTMETNSENKVSQFAKCYDDKEVNVEIALDSTMFMEDVAMPYVNFRMEYEDKNEAMWLAVYNAVYRALDVKYGGTTEYYSLWPTKSYSEGGDKEYMIVDEYNIMDLLFVFTNEVEYELDLSTMPDYLRELVTYDEESEQLSIEIDEQYIKDFDYEYAATKINDGKCSVYGKMNVEGEDRLFSFVLNGNGVNNFRVAIEDLKF